MNVLPKYRTLFESPPPPPVKPEAPSQACPAYGFGTNGASRSWTPPSAPTLPADFLRRARS